GSCRLNLRERFLIGFELEVAIRTPAAAIKGDDNGPLLKKRRDVDDFTLRVVQHDRRRAIADFKHRAGDNAVAQLIDMTLHDRLALRWNTLVPAVAIFSELFFQGHTGLRYRIQNRS